MTSWTAISYTGVSNVAVINGNMNSEILCEVLTKCLLPFAATECPQNWIFQQGNASCHTNNHTNVS